jgi:hypothetical protein
MKSERKKVLLFLPEHELHELALLYFNYVLRKLGHETLYLGQSTPLISAVEINKKWQADIIITGILSGFSDINPPDFISQLSMSFSTQKVLIAGALADDSIKIEYPNIFKIRSIEDLKVFL